MSTMKAIQILATGPVSKENISLSADHPRPEMLDGRIMVKVQACSIAAGDLHLIHGKMALLFKPPHIPFIPGMDVCGNVEQVSQSVTGFAVGDSIVATNGAMPCGGLSEYMLVDPAFACKKPPSVDFITASACPVSAVTALQAVEKAGVKSGDRVLVLGGSGGVGSCAIQFAKLAGASFVASTSTQESLLKDVLKVDRYIDYRTENWWEIPELQQNKLDVIIDCVGGNSHYSKASAVLKSRYYGGRFLPVVGDYPSPEILGVFQAAGFIGNLLFRPLWTTFVPFVPKYSMFMNASTSAVIGRVLDLVAEGSLKIVLDEGTPFPFTEDGVLQALTRQASGHAHGKIVIKIAD